MRASDQDRDEAVRALADHYADGRLDHDEFEARMSAASGATYLHDLDPLFADLPSRTPPRSVEVRRHPPVRRPGPWLAFAPFVAVSRRDDGRPHPRRRDVAAVPAVVDRVDRGPASRVGATVAGLDRRLAPRSARRGWSARIRLARLSNRTSIHRRPRGVSYAAAMSLSSRDVAIAAQHGLARLTDALPASLAARAGGGPVVVDGQTLDPHLAMVLALERRLRPSDEGRSVQQRRVALRESAAIAAGRPIPVGSVRDLSVDGAVGPLRARLYSPAPRPEAAARPLVVFFHGGGWVVGDIESHDQPCRLLCRYADVHVLSVDYRLAPENPFPAAVEDAITAFAWAAANAARLGADPARVAVAGDSAGGTLAAVVAQETRDSGTVQPVAQLLVYPGADGSVSRPSKSLFGEGFLLTRAQMDWYWDTYRGDAPSTDPRLSPLLADDLSGLAPALVTTAAFDPLRDEGEAYAAALRTAGTPVVLRRASGLVHGYLSMTGVHRASRHESLAVAGAFAALLETVPGR